MVLCGSFFLLLLLLAGGPDGRGLSKTKELEMPTGTVKFFNDTRGFGFITPDEGGNDAFVHISAVEKAGMRSLIEGQRLNYELGEDRRGKMAAVNLTAADGATSSSDAQQAE